MRKIYLFLLLLVSGITFGQVILSGDAHYVLSCKYSLGDARDGCGFGGVQWLDLIRSQGLPYYLKPDDNTTWHNTSGTFNDYQFTESNPVVRFQLRSTKRKDSWGCYTEHERLADLAIQRNETRSYVNMVEDGGALAFGGTITMTTFPVINLTNSDDANNILGTESPLNIPPIPGVLPEFFQWEYYILGDDTPYTVMVPDPDCEEGAPDLMSAKIIDPDNPPIDCPDIPVTEYKPKWHKFPVQYQGKNSMLIDSCKNVFPVLALGKTITIRANSNGKGKNLVFKYNASAPHIVSKEAIETKCFDSKDGRLKLKLSRQLMSGEQLTCQVDQFDEVTHELMSQVYATAKDESITVGDDLTYELPYNFAKGSYRLKLLGFYKNAQGYGANTYAMDPEHQTNFSIGSPTAVGFDVTDKTDVHCYGGNDGVINIKAFGGTINGIYQYSVDHGASWKNFNNNDKHSLSGLSIGTYNVQVRKIKDISDTVGCVAKLPNESIKDVSEEIKQPPTAISVTNTPAFLVQPSFYGAVNGSITISITGGTPKAGANAIDGDSYSFEWSNLNYTKEQLASRTTTDYKNGIYALTLNNIKVGTYNLTVQDVNGCSLDPVSQPKLSIVLTEPDPIEITIAVTTPISCNTANFDPITGSALKLADGSLTATVKGGVPLSANENHGLLYYYTWSKKNPVTNLWEVLTDVTGVTANSLSEGNYSLNVQDKKGIVQGTYSTTALITALPTEKLLKEPAALALQLTSIPISCYDGANGSAAVSVTGGTGSYSYKWSTNATTPTIAGLNANNYYVTVTDYKGCNTNDGIAVTEPASQVVVQYVTVNNPTYSGASNGKMIVNVSGGTIKDDNSYGYEWKNSKGDKPNTTVAYDSSTKIYTITLDNVPADDYFLTVWDKNYDAAKPAQITNCSIINSTKTLEQPKPLKVTFEIKKTISCNAKNADGNDVDVAPADGQRDESQDGILVAHVTGGIQLLTADNNGLPYFYKWKKQQVNNSWKDLNTIKDSIALNLSHGNYSLNIEDRNGIVLGTYDVNNNLISAKDSIQLMQEPALFAVSITKGDVYCNGGNDGWATALATGGTPIYDYLWSNSEAIAENTVLRQGDYSIVVTDDKKCLAKDNVTIVEPVNPIALKYIEVINPSFYKATNGKIVVEVNGGTPFADKSYGYEWKNSAGVIQTATSQVNNGIYTLTLNGLAEDVYTLTIKDANYATATNKVGCTIINSAQTLDDPDPLEVTFEVQRTISCNVSNQFGNETDTTPKDGQRDESQDGILIAHVTGGIALDANQNNGLSYFYNWKKQLADNTWIPWNDQDETAANLSNGTYALNVEDKNGIKLGTYVNNILTQEIDVTQPMPEPEKLTLTFTKFDVGCTTGDDGWAEAHVTGGTSPYSYQWTNEATTAKIERLTTNNYFVMVTDAKGCTVQGSIFVGDPNGIIATGTAINPTCFKGNDGAITLDVKGGNLPYTFLWNTGATIQNLSQLSAGSYEVTITCPDCCVYKKRFTLTEPAPIVINLGLDRTLCSEQSLDLNATIADAKAQYSWTATNGFTANSAMVNLTKAGIYHVKVTSELGCIGEDEIEIKTNNVAINSEFLLSSQAYLDEEVILVNSSSPFGESTQWVIPENVKIVEQKEKFITLKFAKAGIYTIALKQTQGDCYALYSKNISVETRSTLPNAAITNTQFIKDFIVTPNPNDGNFKALINLENNSPINLRLFSYNGQYSLIQRKEDGKKNYVVDFNVKLAAGMYVLVLETVQQTLVKKIIIY